MTRSTARSDQAKAYRRLYKTARWRRTREAQLAKQPLCQTCRTEGRVTAATVCDHIDPNKKLDSATFYDGPFQSLCDQEPWRCHSSRKQSDERREQAGRLPIQTVGSDGWPV